MRRAVEWMFEDRTSTTGRLVVAQFPNAPLWVFLAAKILGFDTFASVALGVWAVLELVKGVNPFRRIIGAVVLLGLIF